MQKVYLEIDAKTGALKAKLNTSSGDVKTWALEAEKSGKRAAKGIDETTKSADRLGSSLTNVKGLLASAFTAAGIVAAGKNIIRTADAVAEMEGRLKVATRTQAEFNKAQAEVVNISKRSATQIGETVNLYARLSVALRQTELAQRDVFRITETVNKAFTVSGATTVEAANAIRQLSQGMASGVLRGEEYNAITEQGDRIVQALADTLGKTRGELRAMANDGKLTAEIVTGALLEQSRAIDAEYKQFPITVARSITLMSNAWTEYIANSETAREVSESVASAIVFLSENLETLIDLTLTATQVVIALAGAKGLKALAASFTASRAAAAAATSSAYSYSAAMGAAKASTTAFGTAVGTVSKFLKTNALGIAIFGGIELIQFIGDLTEKLEGLPTPVDRVNDAFEEGFTFEALTAAAAEVDNLKDRVVELNVKLEENSRAMGQASLDAMDLRTGWNSTLRANVNLRDSLKETELALTKATWADRLATAMSVADGVITVFKDNYKTLTTEVEESNKAIDRWIESTEKQTQKLANANEAFGKGEAAILKLEAAQLKATTTNKKYHEQIDRVTDAKIKQIEISEKLKEEERELNEAVRVAIELAESYVEATDPIGAAQGLQAEQLAQIELAYKAGKLSQEEYENAIKGAAKTVSDAEAGLKKYEDRIRTADDVLEDLGITNNRVEADLLLLKTALDAANASMDTAAAERYAQAIQMIGDQTARANANPLTVQAGEAIFGGLFSGGGLDGFVGALDGVFQSAISGIGTAVAEGFAAGGFSGGVSGLSSGIAAVPVVGWIAAAMALNDGFFQDGWRANDAEFEGFGQITGSATLLLDRTLQSLGLSERVASLLSGSSVHARLFGRKAPEIEQQGFNATLGADGLFGETFANIIREGGVFRSDRRYTETGELTTEIVDQFNRLFDTVKDIIEQVTRDIRSDYEGFVEGTFNQTFDKKGELISEGSTFFGVEYAEDFEAFVARLTAENILAALGSATEQIETIVEERFRFNEDVDYGLPDLVFTRTQVINELHLLAEAYRGNAEDLLEFAYFAQAAITDIVNGEGLLDTITEVTAIVEEYQHAQESLGEAYARIKGSTVLTEQALESMGITLDVSRETLVRFATEITEAAGGLEQAAALWEGYFSRFYSAQELSDLEIGRAGTASAEGLAEVGLDSNTTLSEFREAFESVFAELSPEDVVTWLEAGNALATYNELLAEQAQLQLEASNAFAEAMSDVNNDVLGLLRSDFQNTLAEIEAQERETIATLNDLAVAAGRAEASEEELGRVHMRTALQTQRAIGQLRQAAESLVNELYGDQLDQRIAELEAIQNNGVTSVGNAAENTYERQLALIRRIRDVIDSTLINERLSPLTRTEQLNEGVAQFQELIALANTGDLEAQAQLPALYQELLGIGRDVFASGQGYTDLYAQLTNLLETVTPTGSPGSGGPATVIMTPSPELAALYAERDARLAEQTAAERLELAAQLSEYLVDLAGALNTPLIEIAEELGLNMGDLVTDLGVNLDNITAETVNQLANVSNSLGISLSTLTTNLGDNIAAELGDLANAQSLLNDALESRINLLPAEFRNNLAPLLMAVENAADGTERDAALAALEAATAELPIEQRNALAPFFEGIDPVSELEEQIGIARRMETAAEARRLLLERQANVMTEVRNNLRAQNTAQGLPSYDVGTTYVPYDQVAKIHKGEVIMTAQEAAIMRKYFGSGGNISSGRSSVTMETLLRDLIGAVKAGSAATSDKLESIREEGATKRLYSSRLDKDTLDVNPRRKPQAIPQSGGDYI